MKYEVFTLGKHYLHVHTSKGFTLFANAKLVNGVLSSYTDKMVRRGGSWVIDVWRFLNKKTFPINPIYTAVFGFADDDDEVQVTATDIDVESISGVNGQMVDIGNISLPAGNTLPVSVNTGESLPVTEFSQPVEKRVLQVDGNFITNWFSSEEKHNFLYCKGSFHEGNIYVNNDVFTTDTTQNVLCRLLNIDVVAKYNSSNVHTNDVLQFVGHALTGSANLQKIEISASVLNYSPLLEMFYKLEDKIVSYTIPL